MFHNHSLIRSHVLNRPNPLKTTPAPLEAERAHALELKDTLLPPSSLPSHLLAPSSPPSSLLPPICLPLSLPSVRLQSNSRFVLPLEHKLQLEASLLTTGTFGLVAMQHKV